MRRRAVIFTLRFGLPIVLVVAGVVLIVMGHAHVSDVQDSPSGSSIFTSIPTDRDSMYSAAGVSALIVALMILMIGWFIRLNVQDAPDREAEQEARDYFARTGRWPGEPGPLGPGAAPSPGVAPGDPRRP